LLFFVLHVKSSQAVIAALHEKDVENYGEVDTLIIQTRCQKARYCNILMRLIILYEEHKLVEKKEYKILNFVHFLLVTLETKLATPFL
jgi:hypothetical protein